MPIDKASFRNKGGMVQSIISQYKLARYFSKHGIGNVIKYNVEICLTEGAYLEIGNNCVIQNGTFIQLTKPTPQLVIGNDVVVGRYNMLTVKRLVKIGDHTRIGAFVQIIDHDHGIERNKLIKDQNARIKPTIIGKDVWIGAGAKILRGVKVGEGSVIGSNTVVVKDVRPYSVIGGVPGRFIKERS